jgi:hypothetical protein
LLIKLQCELGRGKRSVQAERVIKRVRPGTSGCLVDEYGNSGIFAISAPETQVLAFADAIQWHEGDLRGISTDFF